MRRRKELVCGLLLFSFCLFFPQIPQAAINEHIEARSAFVLNMENGEVLFEQNADRLIAPASITKILTLYLVFEAVKQGHIRPSDKVEVSRRAASTGGSRMGLKAGTFVSMEELIKGIAVVSGNDACVAAAEHISGSVERFVKKMNVKARALGMTRSRFMTPNGLPADGHVTTARDIAKLSSAYLRRFPESLTIHSMQSYTHGKHLHHNANRLLGKWPGVDGLKTGFVCASGYNISATASRNHTRIIVVVMGARNPWIRCHEAEKLIEAGFREAGCPYYDIKGVEVAATSRGKALSSKRKCYSCRVQEKARIKRTGNEKKVVAGGNAKSKKNVSVQEKKIGKAAKKITAKKGKIPSRYASVRNKPEERVSGKKSGSSKSSAASAKTCRNKAKPDKRSRDSTKKAANKKNAKKGVPHANAFKKRPRG